MSSFELVTGPTSEPVSVEDMNAYSRVEMDQPEEDLLVLRLIKLARELVENDSERQLMTATWKLNLDAFPRSNGAIELRKPPIQSVTSLTYYDSDGSLQTLDASKYDADVLSTPGRIVPAFGESWPVTRNGFPNAVIVEFVAGFTSALLVPERAKQCIRLLADHWFNNRGIVGTAVEIAFTYRALISGLQWRAYHDWGAQ